MQITHGDGKTSEMACRYVYGNPAYARVTYQYPDRAGEHYVPVADVEAVSSMIVQGGGVVQHIFYQGGRG